jgi:predicted ATPase/class 3 adenylate cyclase
MPPTSTATLLFTDIEGSTRRWEESPGMSEQVERHFAVLRGAVEAAGGRVFATAGDGVAAVFRSAGGAVRAAVDAQRSMGAVGLRVRMGIHTGEVERVGDDFRGRPVNRAARIMGVARGGQILVSDVTAGLVRAGSGGTAVELAAAGVRRLRDLDEPEQLWQVVHPDLDGGPAPADGEAEPASFPSPRSALVGRAADLDRVRAALERGRIVTLTGVGGVGKTRLAIAAAAELGHGYPQVWFVPLASVTDPDDVGGAVAVAVGTGSAADPVGAAVAALAVAPALLVLDNCEHVVDRAADVVDRLAASCPRLAVVVTSREALGIDGEEVLRVRPLDPVTDAVELFHQRASAAGADLSDVPRDAIEALCVQLDGLPLAIELAAARAATLGVGAIAGALDDRRSLLRLGRRRADDRHGTIRTTIEWSYRLLEPDEQRLFRWLAAFANGFELDAATHVAAALGIDADDAAAHLASLVHKSMVTVESRVGGARHRMLETVRAFAFEELDDRGELLDARLAVARWITTIAGLPAGDPCSAAVERSSVRLEREADDWRDAAVLAERLGSGALAAGLCGPPADFFLLGRHDLADVVRPLLDVCGEAEHRRAVLCALVVSASGGTDAAQVDAWAAEVQRIDDLDPTGLGGLMRWLALAWQGDFERSVDVCVAASLDERLAVATRDLFVGIAVLDTFSLTDATDDRHGLVDRALAIAERTDVALTRVTCLLGVAWSLVDADPERAVALVRRALDDIDRVPALTRLALPGSAARLLSRLDPRVAARALLDQLDSSPVGGRAGRSFVDLVPIFYGAALLDQREASRPEALPLSMMDVVDNARRAAAGRDLGDLAELEATVRAGLLALAG